MVAWILQVSGYLSAQPDSFLGDAFACRTPFTLDLWDLSKKVNSNEEQQSGFNSRLFGWKSSIGTRTKGQSTRQGSELRALPIGEKRVKSDPEWKANQTNVPDTKPQSVSCRLSLSQVPQSSSSRCRLKAWSKFPQDGGCRPGMRPQALTIAILTTQREPWGPQLTKHCSPWEHRGRWNVGFEDRI